MPREHGTARGIAQHEYRREKLCPACRAVSRAARQAVQYERRNRGRCAPGLGWPLVVPRG